MGEWDMCRNDGNTPSAASSGDRWLRFSELLARRTRDIALLKVPPAPRRTWASCSSRRRRPGQGVGPRRAASPSAAVWQLRGRALVTGAGPIGLLAAPDGPSARGCEVHAARTRPPRPVPSAHLVEGLGAHYHAGDGRATSPPAADVVIECTGLGAVGRAAGQKVASGGMMCLTGIMDADPQLDVDATALNRRMVLHNQLLFGTVNAGRRHWAQAADALAAADPAWLRAMITRRVRPTRWDEALDRQPEDIKVVVELAA